MDAGFNYPIRIKHHIPLNFYNKIQKSVFALVIVWFALWNAPALAVNSPKITQVEMSEGQITIQYSSSQPLLGLNIYRDGEYLTTIKPAPQQGSVTFAGESGGYCIVAIVTNEQFSACSATVNSAVGVPTAFRATVYSDSAAELFWSEPADNTPVASYRLFRDGRMLFEGDGKSYFEDGLVSGVVYRYSLMSVDTDGRQSDAVTYALTAGSRNQPDPEPALSTLAAPGNFRGQYYSATAAELFWDAVPGDSIQYQLSRDGVALSTLDGRSYFEPTLQSGRSYQYQLSAIDAAGATSENISFTLTPQSGGVVNNADFAIVLAPDRFNLAEGDETGLVVPIQIERYNGNRAPINLSLRSEQGEFARVQRYSFDHTTIQGESSTNLRIWLEIAAKPLQYQERRYILSAEQEGRRTETTLYLDVIPVDAPDVYLLIGQSNMEGASELYIKNSSPGGPDERNPRIRQLNVRQNSTEAFSQSWQFTDEQANVGDPRFIEAEDPLHEPRAAWQSRKEAQFIGVGLSFAKAALTQTTQQIYLVPAAWSATGFCGNGFGDVAWNAYATDAASHGGTLLADRALTRLNMTLRETGGILRGILWHQGEADSNNPDCAYRYQANLQRLATRLREQARGDRRGAAGRGVDSDIPFIVATMSKGQDDRGDYSRFGGLKTVVDTVHRNVSLSIPHADFVNNDDLRPPNYPCGQSSCVHFGGAAYREMGYRFYQALNGVWVRDGN